MDLIENVMECQHAWIRGIDTGSILCNTCSLIVYPTGKPFIGDDDFQAGGSIIYDKLSHRDKIRLLNSCRASSPPSEFLDAMECYLRSLNSGDEQQVQEFDVFLNDLENSVERIKADSVKVSDVSGHLKFYREEILIASFSTESKWTHFKPHPHGE
jgi:hypothetical protein